MKKRIKEFYILYIRIGFFHTIKLLLGDKKINVSKKTESSKVITLKNPELKADIILRSDFADFMLYNEIFNNEEYLCPFDSEPKNILDCGANIGLTSVYFANKYPYAQVISLEPDDNNFQTLMQNVKPYANISPIKGGVWSETTQLYIQNDSDNQGWDIKVIEQKTNIVVDVFSINQIMKNFNIETIDILKIDIEGSEKQLFRDNTEWLSKVKLLIIELHNMYDTGISDVFFGKMATYNFIIKYKGENLFCYNKNII